MAPVTMERNGNLYMRSIKRATSYMTYCAL